MDTLFSQIHRIVELLLIAKVENKMLTSIGHVHAMTHNLICLPFKV